MNWRDIHESLTWAAAALILLTATESVAQDYESHVITIDVNSPQPVGTGFIPANSNGELLILAEGNIKTISQSKRFDDGWFGPNGYTRLMRAGQPISGGMPYGALVGGFSATISNYRFVGRMGAFHLLPAHVGQEFRLALNIPAADVPLLSGQLTVTVIYVADGYPDIARFPITDGTALPIATGLTAAAGDRFVVLPYGTIQTDAHVGAMEGYFGPEGLPKLNRAGQPFAEGPYGGLYGHFIDPAQSFYIGDGGSWRVLPAEVGLELFLNLNLDPVDLVGCDGRFVVNVIRIPQ